MYLFGVGMGKSPHDHTVQEDVVKLFFTYIENFFDLDPATQCVPCLLLIYSCRKEFLITLCKCCSALMNSSPPLAMTSAVEFTKAPLIDVSA